MDDTGLKAGDGKEAVRGKAGASLAVDNRKWAHYDHLSFSPVEEQSIDRESNS